MTRIPFGAKFIDKNSTRLLIFLLLLLRLEPLAQLVEHRPFKAGVPGSNPGRLTIFRDLRRPLYRQSRIEPPPLARFARRFVPVAVGVWK